MPHILQRPVDSQIMAFSNMRSCPCTIASTYTNSANKVVTPGQDCLCCCDGHNLWPTLPTSDCHQQALLHCLRLYNKKYYFEMANRQSLYLENAVKQIQPEGRRERVCTIRLSPLSLNSSTITPLRILDNRELITSDFNHCSQ